MASFAYVAKSQSGKEVSGLVEGANMDDAVGRLHSQGLVVLHVAESHVQADSSSLSERLSSLTRGSVGTRDLALFTRQLSTVLQAGIPLVRGLRGLAADMSSRTLCVAVDDVALRIERGEGLSEAMTAHPEAFNKMYISMIRAGERAGTLDDILEDLATYLEKVDAIKTKVRSALSYPIFVLVFAILATLFMLFKIVPTFAEIYQELGQDLPGLTKAVIGASNSIRDNAVVSGLVAVSIVTLLVLWSRTRAGRYAVDSFVIRVPLFGPIVRKAVMSRFARTLGILVRSGLPILEAMDLVKGASGNAYVAGAIEQAKERISAGQGITSAFRSTSRFPEMVLQLMATGEESGSLDSMLIKASEFYDRQVEAAVHGITSLIEPVMVVLVGGIIGVVVVAMFLPIFHMGEAVMRGGFNF
jgi:type IV pilus assembly protein PilC